MSESVTYVFMPDAGACAESISLIITPEVPVQASFDLPSSICQYEEVINLPESSNEALTGSWDQSIIATDVAGEFTFTFAPNDECADEYTHTINIEAQVIPSFESLSVCLGESAELPTDPIAGEITGSWEPAMIDTDQAGSYEYTFTPDEPYCASLANLTVEVLDTQVSIFYEDGLLTTNVVDAVNYQWYQGDELLEANLPSYVPASSGVYFVSISTEEGCTASSELIVVELESVSTQDMEEKLLALAPNPFSSSFNISLNDATPATIEIFDFTGRLIESRIISSNYTIEAVSWQSGIYLLRISQGDWTSTKRIIRQ